MYAKIFTQIFDSSIASNYQHRHVFEDLLKLADINGDVNMTIDAVARRTNAPLEIVAEAIAQLLKPDPESQTRDFEGRRIIPLDEHRSWGWHIVNYAKYRAIQDEIARRDTWREAKAKQRAKLKRKPKPAKPERKPAPITSPVLEKQFIKQLENGDTTGANLTIDSSNPPKVAFPDDCPL